MVSKANVAVVEIGSSRESGGIIGFKSDPVLFDDAYTSILEANAKIKSCQGIIRNMTALKNEAALNSISDYASLENCILNFKTNPLEQKITEVLMSVMELDPEFTWTYLNTSREKAESLGGDINKTDSELKNMSEEEMQAHNELKDKYSAQKQNYDKTYLAVLEKMEKAGTLNPDAKETIEYQKSIVRQQEIINEMATLDTTSPKYSSLYDELVGCQKETINLNPNLTAEQKEEALKILENQYEEIKAQLKLNQDISCVMNSLNELKNEGKVGTKEYYEKQIQIYDYQIDYLENKTNKTQEELENLENQKKYKKLMQLYIDKLELGSNWVPFDSHKLDDDIINLKSELGIASEEELEYLGMDGFTKALHNTGTAVISVFDGLANVVEQIVDGAAMLIGQIYSYAPYIMESMMSGSTIPNGGIYQQTYAPLDTKAFEDFVKMDISGTLYHGAVTGFGINEVIGFGTAHEVGSFAGEMIGTIALQFIPGGTAVTVAAHGLKGMGSSGEKALNLGADWDRAFAYSFATGAVEAGASFILYCNGSLAKSANNALGNAYKWVAGKVGAELAAYTPQFIKTTVGAVVNTVKNTAPKWAQNYATKVFTTKLVTKYTVAIGKEFTKETFGIVIGDEFEWEDFLKNAGVAVVTTSINELIVAPLTDLATNKDSHKNVENKSQSIQNKMDKKTQKLDELRSSKNNSDISELQQLQATQQVPSASPTTSRYEQALQSSIDRLQIRLDNVQITAWDKIIGSGSLTKYLKKVFKELEDTMIFTDSTSLQ